METDIIYEKTERSEIETERSPLLNLNVNTFVCPECSSSFVSSVKYILAMNVVGCFIFTGLSSILFVYLNEFLGFPKELSNFLTNLMLFVNYLLALIGGIMADSISGNYQCIVIGLFIGMISLLLLASSQWLFMIHLNVLVPLGLFSIFLFIIGNGFMKPSVSAFLGDQFHPCEEKLRSTYFSWFYLSIQCGSIVASILIPVVLQEGPSWIPFSIMALLSVIILPTFTFKSRKFNKVPPQGKIFTRFLKVLWEGIIEERRKEDSHWLDKAKPKYGDSVVEDVKTSFQILKVFIPLPLFWAIFFQIYSTWTEMAQNMDRDFHIGQYSFTVPPSEVSAINPLMDIILIPLFDKALYPALTFVGWGLTDLKKMGLGLLFGCGSLISTGFVQLAMQNNTLNFAWILPQIFFVSCAEIATSLTAYEFAYTQAPTNMRGMMTAFWLLTMAAGNAILALFGLLNVDSNTKTIQSFVFAGVLLLAFVLFVFIATGYTYSNRKGDLAIQR